jgi:DDE superfamily endonuclease
MLYIFSSKPFYTDFVRQPQSTDPPSPYIVDNPKFHPYFENAIGGLDGSHFISSGTAEERALARDRKGLTTTNCLAGCDFHHNFTYLSTGWEGSVSDSTMFFDSRITDLRLQSGKFYLADAGFPVADALLIPYRGVRYHLAEWGRADLRCVAFHYKYCHDAYSLLAQPMHRSSLIFAMHQLEI